MHFRDVFCLLFSVIAVGNAKKYEIPSDIHLCNRNSGALEKCLLKVVEEDIRPRLAKGISEMGIPALEPLKIDSATLDTGASFKATFKNLYVHYATEFVLKNFDIDLDKNQVVLPISFPRLRLLSDYTIKGRLLILELNGSGKVDGNLTNIDAVAELHGHRVTKNNKEYIDFNNNSVKIKVGDAQFYFSDLIKGNPEVSEQTNKVVNENIQAIIEELKPFIQETVGTVVFTVARRVFKNFSVDELFPSKS